METSVPPPPASPPPPSPSPTADEAPDRSRTGPIWVTGTGAFLLLAAAAIFVAVQWDHLGDQVKLAILGALTGGFLLAGRRVRRELPATGGVLFHLGALLIPLNTATVAVHAGLPANELLLLEGATATIAWFLLDRVEGSVVLRWAAGASFVVAAAGAAATIGLPTPLVLAVAAVAAQACRAPKPALWWATVAGLGPVIVFAESWLSGSGATAALGLAPTAPGLVWAASGTIAAAVIGREAQRRGVAALLAPAAASLVVGVAASWSVLDPSLDVGLLGAATAFLLIEVAAGLTRRDPFWRGPLGGAAVTAEALALATAPFAALATAWWFLDDLAGGPRPTEIGLAALLAASAWFAGDLRRLAVGRRPGPMRWSAALGSGWWPATIGIAIDVVIGVALLTRSPGAVATAMVALAAAYVATGRPAGHATAVLLAMVAPMVAGLELVAAGRLRFRSSVGWFVVEPGHPAPLVAIALISLAGAVVLATAAVVRARLADPVDNAPIAGALAVAALGPIVAGSLVLAGHVDTTALLLGAAAAAWVVALVLDAGEPAVDARRGVAHLGAVGRGGALLPLLGAGFVGARDTAVLAGLLTVGFVVDAVRCRSEVPLLGLAVSLPVLVAAGAAEVGLDPAGIGVALTMLAVVGAGAHLLLGDRRGWPLLGLVLSAGLAGLGLASTDATTGWLAVLALAGIGGAYAAVHESPVGAALSALTAVTATWGLLADGGVEAFDAYLAPVALVLLVAGGVARRSSRVSSWVADAPAIVLLGGSALYERVAGGGGIHALVVGAVAILAVVAGGARRLAAPLLLGTALLVGLTAHESLSVTRQVPTWGWLAIGGSALVAAGIVMERRDTGPMETGRRLVDVVGTRFH